MAKDIGWHRAMRAAMRRSAAERRCPGCGRRAALAGHWKTVNGEPLRGQWCRWARDSGGRLCDWPGVFLPWTGT